MYGEYDPPVKLRKAGLSLELGRAGEFWYYTRKFRDAVVEQDLSFSRGKLIVNPVEPVNLPRKICSYLFIDLKKPMILGPKEKVKFYVKFPIEIGVILSSGKTFRHLDVFSYVPVKYTLYGVVRRGVICRYWMSDIYEKAPKTEILKEGVMEVRAINNSIQWVDLRQMVFSAHGMKIYYDDKLVSMRANVKISSEDLGETSILDEPLEKGMKKSIEIFMTKKLPGIQQEKFIMDEGL